MSTKKSLESVGAQGIAGMGKNGVYQKVYQGPFCPPELGVPGDFLRFSEPFEGVSGVSYAPDREKMLIFPTY